MSDDGQTVTYTTGRAAKAAGISRSMLLWLWSRGLAVPSVRNSRKGGSASLWSEEDVRALALAVKIRREIERLALAERLPPIRLRQLEPSSGKALAIGMRGVFEVTDRRTVAQVLRAAGGGPVALVGGTGLRK
jgi:hypothetical protein